MPSIEKNGSRKKQRLEGRAVGVRPPISVFPSMSCDMWPGVVMLEDNFYMSLLVLWPFLLQYSAQTHQLSSILIPCDGFTRFQ